MSEQEAACLQSCLAALQWNYHHVPHKCYGAHSRSVPFSCSAPACSCFFLGGTSIALLISQKTSPQPIVRCSPCNCRCVVQGSVCQCLKKASWVNSAWGTLDHLSGNFPHHSQRWSLNVAAINCTYTLWYSPTIIIKKWPFLTTCQHQEISSGQKVAPWWLCYRILEHH